MKLRGIEFGDIWGASGVQGFFGEGYWFHWPLKLIGLWFWGITFVSKTATSMPHKGNMPLQKGSWRPKNLFPKCIVVKFRKKAVLNAVGLSNPGLETLLQTGHWQNRKKPFFISITARSENRIWRLAEMRKITELFQFHLPEFWTNFGLQINFSCPTSKYNIKEWDKFTDEIVESLKILSALRIPLVPKFNIITPIYVVKKIAPYCDAICVTNTIPYGSLSQYIDWKNIFESKESPLKEHGGGGYSGKLLLPLVIDWIKSIREDGITIPINAGGGILSWQDARQILSIPNSKPISIFLGSITILAPWNILSTILYVKFINKQPPD